MTSDYVPLAGEIGRPIECAPGSLVYLEHGAVGLVVDYNGKRGMVVLAPNGAASFREAPATPALVVASGWRIEVDPASRRSAEAGAIEPGTAINSGGDQVVAAATGSGGTIYFSFAGGQVELAHLRLAFAGWRIVHDDGDNWFTIFERESPAAP